MVSPVHVHETTLFNLMTLSVNEYNRVWQRGVSISYDLLKQLVIQFLLDNGANPTTTAIPRGLSPVCNNNNNNNNNLFPSRLTTFTRDDMQT